MKIMFCLGSLNKGGAERVVCNLANYFVEQKNDVAIVVTKFSKKAYELDKRVKIFVLDSPNTGRAFRNIKRIKNLYTFIISFDANIVLGFLQEPIARLLVLKTFFRRIKNIPVIVSVRIDPKTAFKTFKRKMSLPLYNKADGFVFQTNEIKSFFNKSIQSKSVVIANSLTPEFYNIKIPRKRDENRIVSVGRLTEQKNYPMLIDAFKEIKRQFPDYILEIYGDGPMKDALTNQIKKNHLEKSIVLKGNVDNVGEAIKSATLFVMTSNYEGMSNALMEAMALGLPCISTNSAGGGAATLIENGVNGFLVPVDDIPALVESMVDILQNRKLLDNISVAARTSMKKYDPKYINTKWVGFIGHVFKNMIGKVR